MIKLQNCQCGVEPITAKCPDVFWVECPNAKCHIHGPLRLSETAAALAWNEMCEWIRIGKGACDAVVDGLAIPLNARIVYGREDLDNPGYVKIYLERVPEPLTMVECLTECRKMLGYAEGSVTYTPEFIARLAADIDAVLPDAEEGKGS